MAIANGANKYIQRINKAVCEDMASSPEKHNLNQTQSFTVNNNNLSRDNYDIYRSPKSVNKASL